MVQLRVLTCQILVLALTACSSAPKQNVYNPRCGPTPVMAKDLAPLGYKPESGKVLVVHVFASWCPFCRTDLDHMAALFKNGTWNSRNVHLLLIAYKNHSENETTYTRFLQKEFPAIGLPKDAVTTVYIDKSYPELSEVRNASGDAIFAGWSGLPFGLIFGKDQRLAFRGHFTMSDVSEERHYDFIAQLQREACAP